jgi:hypothetical protein
MLPWFFVVVFGLCLVVAYWRNHRAQKQWWREFERKKALQNEILKQDPEYQQWQQELKEIRERYR